MRDGQGIESHAWAGASAAPGDPLGADDLERAPAVLGARYQAILAAVPDIIMEVDQNKVYTWANAAGKAFFGSDVVGKEAARYFEGQQRTYEAVEPLFRGSEGVIYVESWQRRHDGQVRLLAWWCRVLKDPAGNVVGALSTARDVTEARRVDEELRRLNEELERRVAERTQQLATANQELEAFAYSVSHDLRAPLRAIDGFTRILLEDYAPQLGREGQRLCGVVRDSTAKMDQLVNGILALSRTSRIELQPSKVDMATLATSVFHELVESEDKERLDFQVGVLPPARADPTLMRQVWANLLSNAIKYSGQRETSTIRVGSESRAEEIVYSVKDNGAGFDMRYADKLFGVFQRLHSVREFPGTGVGLAIVQRAIHRHGGSAWAESEPDRGATFFFTLPRKET